MSVTQLVASGPLILALPVAAAAGAVTFLSPCCLPLVPGTCPSSPGWPAPADRMPPPPGPLRLRIPRPPRQTGPG